MRDFVWSVKNELHHGEKNRNVCTIDEEWVEENSEKLPSIEMVNFVISVI